MTMTFKTASRNKFGFAPAFIWEPGLRQSHGISSLHTIPGVNARRRRSKSTTAESTKPPSSQPPSSNAPRQGRGKPPSSAEVARLKSAQDRALLVSVLESSSTRRDAKAYLQTFGRVTNESAHSPKLQPKLPPCLNQNLRPEVDLTPHVAIVKLKDAESWDDITFGGVAKTLAQLKTLGMNSIVIVDTQSNQYHGQQEGRSWRESVSKQIARLVTAIDKHDEPGVRVVDAALSAQRVFAPQGSRGKIRTANGEALMRPLTAGQMTVVPAWEFLPESLECSPTNSDQTILSLLKYLSGLQAGLQPWPWPADQSGENIALDAPARQCHAFIDRIIVIDALGGIPSKNRVNGSHVFINLEDEFEQIQADIVDLNLPRQHAENLRLAKEALEILPPTSSIVITSPAEAANLQQNWSDQGGLTSLVGVVGTRRKQNPLIYNLITNRPVYSSSLPSGRLASFENGPSVPGTSGPLLSNTTLVRRGMPVTIFPDLRLGAWQPPRPGSSRFRLTDAHVDLGRLVNLIDDSFGRKLDVQHYLERVKDNLAGIVIAGQYEGGAILTWERPNSIDEETATREGRWVPYLDKFAVLRRSQGSGGVADIVFNAMTHKCFPNGVCWRSRKNNPVNRWYFERSAGTWKLDRSYWAMFWTTPNVAMDEEKMRGYEDVCRNIIPSWVDMEKPAD